MQYGDYMKTLGTAKNFKELVIVKVGTSTLTRTNFTGKIVIDEQSFNKIGSQIIALTTKGMAVAIVSSGAIAAGYAYSHKARTHESRQDIIEKQRMACLGQSTLMNYWQNALKPRLAGQLLFTRRELDSTEGCELADVTRRLFERGDIPVANENDALTHEEVTFGDNDTLAARFTSLLHASGFFERTRLVILSDIDGVYEDISDQNSVISEISDIAAYEHLADRAGSANGTGGMASKFNAAKIATQNGIEMYIANGRTARAIERTLDHEIGTCFRSDD
jgi:glutamate 5-kinase